MSASPVARQVVSSAIPVSRRITINSESDLPNDLSSTPGGSLFSTTPGGTRIYYDRAFLLSMKTSPLARTPPANLPIIKGVTVPYDSPSPPREGSTSPKKSLGPVPVIKTTSPEPPLSPKEDDQFQLEL